MARTRQGLGASLLYFAGSDGGRFLARWKRPPVASRRTGSDGRARWKRRASPPVGRWQRRTSLLGSLEATVRRFPAFPGATCVRV